MKKTSKLLIILFAFVTAFTVSCSKEKEEELPKFKVTFESNGGSTIVTQEVEAGSKINKPSNPTKKDAIFGGWFVDQDFKDEWDFSKDVVVDNNITLYAKWTSQYTVVFDAKGGSPTPDTLKVEVGSAISKPVDPTMENGIFLGWFTDETFEEEWNFETGTVTKNLILFAKWTMNHIITFDVQGGIPTPPQQDLKDGERITEPTPQPTKEGYRFMGWSTEIDHNFPWDFNATIFSSKTLYAFWEESITYTITFETNGGGEVSSQKILEGEQAIEPKAPVKEGFILDGWYVDKDFYEKYEFKNSVIENLTLYAKWIDNREQFKVKFIIPNPIDDKETITIQTVPAGSKLTEPTVPKVDGFMFSHWKYNSSIWDFEKGIVKSNMELRAIYQESFYVAFNTNGGSPTVATKTIVEGDLIDEPTGIINGNKTLEGWYPPVNGKPSQKWDFNQRFMSSFADENKTFTLTAKWVETVTVTFKNGDAVHDTKSVVQGNILPQPLPPTTAPAGSQGTKFIGWSRTADDQSNLWKFNDDRVEGTITLYAIWAASEPTYTVNFYSNQEESTPYKTVSGIKYNETIKEVITPPTSADKKFENWTYKNENGDDVFFTVNQHRIQKNMEVYASWLAYYTVSFDTEGGSTPPTNQKVLNGKSVKKPIKNPTKNGFLFAYWGEKKIDWDEQESIYEYDFINNSVHQDFVLYAKWITTGTMVNVSFYDEKGVEPIHTEQVEIGKTIKAHTAPTEEGKIFVGWMNRDNGTIWDFSSPIIKEIHFYAQYVNANEIVQVSFSTWNSSSNNWIVGGNNTPAQEVLMGSLITEPSAPISYTHPFIGWYTQETAGEKWDFAHDKVLTQYGLQLYTRWGDPLPDARLYQHIQDIKGIYNDYDAEYLYTTESWTAFEKAMEEIEIEIITNTLTDTQVEEGIAKLNQAVSQLIKKQIGATEKIEIDASFDGQGNLILIGAYHNQTRMPLASYTYAQMQNLGQSNYLYANTYDANGNPTSTSVQGIGDDKMWEWIYGIDSEQSYSSTRINIRVKESGTSGKLTLIADNTKLVIPVKYYTYNQAKSLLLTEMRKLPTTEVLDYTHIELIDNLNSLVDDLRNVNFSDSEIQAAERKLESYEIYNIPIERDGENFAILGEDGRFAYKEVGGFPYGEYTDEWEFDSYDGIFRQYKTELNANGTVQDSYRESATKDENTEWKLDYKGTLSINPADDNTDQKYNVYIAYSYNESPRSLQSRATSKKGKSPFLKIIEKQKAEKRTARK